MTFLVHAMRLMNSSVSPGDKILIHQNKNAEKLENLVGVERKKEETN